MKRINKTGIIAIILLSLTFFSMECLAIRKPADIIERLYGHVSDENGYPISNLDVSTFDGFTFRNAKTDNMGQYNISELPVSKNNYLVIFFTKEGFIPKADNIVVKEQKNIEHSSVMKINSMEHAGFIIGTVYQPIRGGKLQFNNGIKAFSKSIEVLLENNGNVITKETDMNGHFLFEAPPGKYTLSKGGSKEKLEIDLSAGKTVIKNLRSGFVLID